MPIPLIDLFAGPGGLNEGFSHVRDSQGRRIFETVLSVERDHWAHQTLELRALFRRLDSDKSKCRYFEYVSGRITREKLFEEMGAASKVAASEALLAELGKPATSREVEDRVAAALTRLGTRECVLIGGPPCQAYSLVGRARRSREALVDFEADPKHRLYLEYLKVVRRFKPAVFVMENVPGLLSAKWQSNGMFDMICKGLRDAGYELHGLGDEAAQGLLFENSREFVLHAEEHGVPQSRNRLFIFGVRNDIGKRPRRMVADRTALVSASAALRDLPPIRSRMSKEADSAKSWRAAITEIAGYAFNNLEPNFAKALKKRAESIPDTLALGGQVLDATATPSIHTSWYSDSLLSVVLNHNSRGHMRRDLLRYFFWAEYGRHYERSPTLRDAPHFLRPNHANAAMEGAPFVDRFRVQLAKKPSTTITSHIAKDGHYYIHYDSLQCRSLSVREAARLQTFPDNYYFEGPVTEQYQQVGNAVPPYLAKQIGSIVGSILG
ncbi:MAG TPA: DNA cytosine methyltransferase [Opitutaceae bacterium]|nr:DNA cytosine methyltransferase [Opitutaceae bacterium]